MGYFCLAGACLVCLFFITEYRVGKTDPGFSYLHVLPMLSFSGLFELMVVNLSFLELSVLLALN